MAFRPCAAGLKAPSSGGLSNAALTTPLGFLLEGVYDAHPIQLSLSLQVFGEKYTAACLFGRSQDQGIPKGKAM